MKRISLLFAIIIVISSCNHAPSFKISGSIDGAEGKTLYLKRFDLGRTLTLDSIKLKNNGAFTFSIEKTEFPELYRLGIDNKQLVLAVDSTTEHITIKTSYDSLSYAIVNGSEQTNQITELRRSLLTKPVDEHKQYARTMIISNPRNLVAYYALFQSKAGQLIFDIDDKNDRICYQAVATAWHAFLPKAPRSKSIYNFTLQVIEQERYNLNRQLMQEFIDNSENSFLDIALPDENDKICYLSDLKGKVILLDFSAVAMEQSAAYLFEIKDIYNAYHGKGLEIYSVSGDSNKLLWEESAQNLPWVTVRPEDGVYNQVFSLYNVQVLPTLFLYNKKGEIVGRYTNFDTLKKAIETNL